MHPAISINTLCFWPAAIDEVTEAVARLGARAISPTADDLTHRGTAVRRFRDAGLAVATLTHRAFGYASADETTAQRERLDRTVDLAGAIGADSITMTTGGRGALTWLQACSRFAEAIAPCAERARMAGVKLAIEPTSHLYADVSIAHRLTDTVTLAQAAGIAIGIDVFACWTDADLDAAIAAAGPLAALVQVSDYVAGDRGLPCRAVPGDGMVRLDRILPAIVAAGCRGWFDLEIIGPRIEREGPEPALVRAAAHVGRILTGAGLPAD